jgi:hypothetical protein
VSARKLREWEVYAEIEPFGAPAAFWRAGMITSMLANVNRTKKAERAYKPEDFMPKTMTPEQDREGQQDVGAAALQVFQDLTALDRAQGMRKP